MHDLLFQTYCSKKIVILSFISAEQTSVFESSALKFNSSPRKNDVILNGVCIEIIQLVPLHLDFGLSRNYCNRSTITHEFLLTSKKKTQSDKYTSFKCFCTLGKKIDSLKKLRVLTFSVSCIINQLISCIIRCLKS